MLICTSLLGKVPILSPLSWGMILEIPLLFDRSIKFYDH